MLLFLLLAVEIARPGNLPQWYQDAHNCFPDADWRALQTFTTSYFGPNALPVPELYDGKAPQRSSIEISPDVFWGYGDQTQSLSARIVWAVVPGKVSVSAWGVLAEQYRTTSEVRDARGSLVESAAGTEMPGDFYVATTLALLKETPKRPELLLDVVLKTASSKVSNSARFMDTPGYWFSLTLGKSFYIGSTVLDDLRFVANAGFLCYQLNTINQNDAPLFGTKLIFNKAAWTLEAGVHGYSGWLNLGDKPLVFRSKLSFTSGNVSLFTQFQKSLRDYPFNRLQTGFSVQF